MTTIVRFIAACAALFFANVSFAGAEDIYEMTPSEVYQIQNILFERGFNVGFPDGKYGSQTRQGVARVQEVNNWPVTGHLTEEQFNTIIGLGLPKGWVWGAISGAADGAYYAVWNYPLRADAYLTAEKGCRERSSHPEICDTIAVWRNDDVTGWVATVKCERETFDTHYTLLTLGGGSSSAEALENAFKRAEHEGFARYTCSPYVAIAADGSHK